MAMTHYIKHAVDCPPGCDHDWCTCPCSDHTDTCWPGKPDPACLCQQDELPEEGEGDHDPTTRESRKRGKPA